MNEGFDNPYCLYHKINVDGTLNLARQAAVNGVKRFIYISSIKVNGESTRVNSPFTEKIFLHQRMLMGFQARCRK